MAQSLQEIAVARFAAGDISEARTYMSESLAQFDAIGNRWSVLAGMKVLTGPTPRRHRDLSRPGPFWRKSSPRYAQAIPSSFGGSIA
jgi:hypothetical protein